MQTVIISYCGGLKPPLERHDMTRTLRARAAAMLGATTLVAASLLGGVSAMADAAPLQLDQGHIDLFNLHLKDDGNAGLNLKEDVTGQHVPHEPGDFVLFVKADSLVQNLPAQAIPQSVPSDAAYYLPITQDHNLVWPGWDSLQLQPKYGANLKADINIKSVDGPGEISIWSSGAWGGVTPLMKDGDYTFPGTIQQDMAAHVHANWAFSKPGTYKLVVQATVTSEDGKLTSTTEEETYTIVVQSAPESVTVTGAEKPVTVGDNVTLSAAKSPEDAGFETYTWESREVSGSERAAGDWKVAGEGASISVPAKAGVEYRVSVTGGKDYGNNAAPVSVTSEPVSIQVTEDPTETPQPTAEPTAEPTVEPTAEPTEEPTGTPEPTAEPTNTPEPAESAPATGGPTASVTSAPGNTDDENGGSEGNGPGQQPPAGAGGNNSAGADQNGAGNQAGNGQAAAGGATSTPGAKTGGNHLAATGAEPMLPIAFGALVLGAAGVALLRRTMRAE